jgi:hypothetical protein
MGRGNGAALAQGNSNMARNNSKPTVQPTAKVAPALRAAAIVAQHGLAALPRVAAATGTAPASNKRYGVALNALTPSFATATFTLTALGKAAVTAAGCTGRNGQPTAMGLTALALGHAANGGLSATGAAIVTAIIGNPQLMAGMLGTKANGTHLLPNTATAAKWAQGYVNGLCRPQHGLATKALA